MDPTNKNIKEKDELTGDEVLSGHEYDGIKELDNNLPKWWLWLFYITIIWSAAYMVHFFVLETGDLQAAEYQKEMAEAAKQYKKTADPGQESEHLVVFTDEENLTEGKAIYDKHCAVCHLAQGQGLVGPNFTDKHWIHGGSFEDIIEIIIVGVPEKGMISWKSQLNPKQIKQVGSYILTFQGTNPPNGKAPEGELYQPEN